MNFTSTHIPAVGLLIPKSRGKYADTITSTFPQSRTCDHSLPDPNTLISTLPSLCPVVMVTDGPPAAGEERP